MENPVQNVEKILELQPDGSTIEAKIELDAQTPYSCNRNCDKHDVRDGHGFPTGYFTARQFLIHCPEFDVLNSFDIIFVLEPYFLKFGQHGIYRKVPRLNEGDTQKWRLVNTNDFRQLLIKEYNFEKYFA